MAENGTSKMSEVNAGTQAATRRLLLWCLPRTCSSALAKCLSFLDSDTEVWFEPFNTCRMLSIHQRKQQGEGLPKRYNGNEAVFKSIAAMLQAQFSCESDPFLLSYEGVKTCLEGSQRRTVVVKEMGVASYDCYDYTPKGFTQVLLIRHPVRVITSFRKVVLQSYKSATPDSDMQELHATYPTLHWFGEMHALWKHLLSRPEANGSGPLIIDTEDLLENPAACLRKICEVMGVEYRNELLQWDASLAAVKKYRNGCPDMRFKMGAPASLFQKADESSCFVPTPPKPLPSEITPDCERIISQCIGFYEEMYPHRFIPSPTK